MNGVHHDWQYCCEALQQVSRSFAIPISMLRDELKVSVTCGYLLCRVADWIEDDPILDPIAREGLFLKYLAYLDGTVTTKGFCATLPNRDAGDPEYDLARNLDRIDRVLATLSIDQQAALRQWVAEMTRGMMVFSHRVPGSTDGIVALLTHGDLDRYCYFVAGTVGHMLTDLFVFAQPTIPDPVKLELRKYAEGFGMALQLVNILKDVAEDMARGWSFIPRSCYADAGIDVQSFSDPGHRLRVHNALIPVIGRAKALMDDAFDYSVRIPESERDIRMFCLVPLWMAIETLKLIPGNDLLFDPVQSVKVPREAVASIVAECQQVAANNTALGRAYQDRTAEFRARDSQPVAAGGYV